MCTLRTLYNENRKLLCFLFDPFNSKENRQERMKKQKKREDEEDRENEHVTSSSSTNVRTLGDAESDAQITHSLTHEREREM